ncbi:MAG: nitroreductase family protein [Bdellovibrionales bacterium]|nr:nitroreductase family protein [Bdellovibrionales bacterium]
MLESQAQQNFNNEKSLKIITELHSIFTKRKSTRHFSDHPVDINIILKAISIAGTAPSGANKQPWSFGVIQDQDTKQIIKQKAEQEEDVFYNQKAPQKWLEDLKPLHTKPKKDFITQASYLIPVFYKNYELDSDNNRDKNYYVKESAGIATGLLISALHLAGLSTLTYTPTNRKFLVDLLGRPSNEGGMMVVATGLPSDNAQTPVISKKQLEEIAFIYSPVKSR